MQKLVSVYSLHKTPPQTPPDRTKAVSAILRSGGTRLKRRIFSDGTPQRSTRRKMAPYSLLLIFKSPDNTQIQYPICLDCGTPNKMASSKHLLPIKNQMFDWACQIMQVPANRLPPTHRLKLFLKTEEIIDLANHTFNSNNPLFILCAAQYILPLYLVDDPIDKGLLKRGDPQITELIESGVEAITKPTEKEVRVCRIRGTREGFLSFRHHFFEIVDQIIPPDHANRPFFNEIYGQFATAHCHYLRAMYFQVAREEEKWPCMTVVHYDRFPESAVIPVEMLSLLFHILTLASEGKLNKEIQETIRQTLNRTDIILGSAATVIDDNDLFSLNRELTEPRAENHIKLLITLRQLERAFIEEAIKNRFNMAALKTHLMAKKQYDLEAMGNYLLQFRDESNFLETLFAGLAPYLKVAIIETLKTGTPQLDVTAENVSLEFKKQIAHIPEYLHPTINQLLDVLKQIQTQKAVLFAWPQNQELKTSIVQSILSCLKQIQTVCVNQLINDITAQPDTDPLKTVLTHICNYDAQIYNEDLRQCLLNPETTEETVTFGLSLISDLNYALSKLTSSANEYFNKLSRRFKRLSSIQKEALTPFYCWAIGHRSYIHGLGQQGLQMGEIILWRRYAQQDPSQVVKVDETYGFAAP